MAEKLITAADIEKHVGSVPDKGDSWYWPGATLNAQAMAAGGWLKIPPTFKEGQIVCGWMSVKFERDGLTLTCTRSYDCSVVRLNRKD